MTKRTINKVAAQTVRALEASGVSRSDIFLTAVVANVATAAAISVVKMTGRGVKALFTPAAPKAAPAPKVCNAPKAPVEEDDKEDFCEV